MATFPAGAVGGAWQVSHFLPHGFGRFAKPDGFKQVPTADSQNNG
jgi:hypothetical protein